MRPDFAFGLTCAGWHGDINGRIPLLHHRRALIMTPTLGRLIILRPRCRPDRYSSGEEREPGGQARMLTG